MQMSQGCTSTRWRGLPTPGHVGGASHWRWRLAMTLYTWTSLNHTAVVLPWVSFFSPISYRTRRPCWRQQHPACCANAAPPAIERSHRSYKLMSNANFEVDRVVNTIAIVNQNHMSPNDDVTVAARGTAHTAYHVIGRRLTHSPHIIIEHVARPNPTLVIIIPLVGVSKHRVVLVLVVISARGLLLILVELAILLLTLAAILILFALAAVLVILCHSRAARQSQQRCHTSCHPPFCVHKFSPFRTGIFILKLWVAVGVRLSALLLHALYDRGRSTCQFITAHRFGQNCSAQFMRRE